MLKSCKATFDCLIFAVVITKKNKFKNLEIMKKVKALAEFLSIKKSEINETSYNQNEFETPEGGYLVLTDIEADELSEEYIKDTLWAFNSNFLASETGIDSEVFEAIQANDRCESNNDAILSMVMSTCGVESFTESAISADGRGHFMNTYDGEEHEYNDYFIYRTN